MNRDFRSSPAVDPSILGLDNIRLDVPVAGVGSRALALAVDYLCLTILLGIWIVVLTLGSTVTEGEWIWAVGFLGFFLLEHGYFIGSEIIFGGRTPGKMAARLRVIHRTGGRPSAAAVLLRNLLRLVDLLVGVFLIAFDPWGRRLGDRVAGTLVVHQPRPEDRTTVERPPAGWGPREVAVAESWLGRWRGMEPERARALARRLLVWVKEDEPALLAGWTGGGDPSEILESVLTRGPANGDPGGDRTSDPARPGGMG